MKTTFASIILNEAEYIGRNLAQHYDACDRWIVVEGADRRYPSDRVTKDGLSTDGTADIVRGFPDPLGKITFIQHGWADDKCELRNRYAELADDGVLIVFDADEFLTHADLAWLIDRTSRLDGPGSVRIPHVHFWKNHRQVIVGGYYDVPHDRAYRWFKGCRYFDNHNHPCLPTSEQPLNRCRHELWNRQFRFEDETGAVAHPEPAWLHMGFCKAPEHVADKNAYYLNRGEATTRPETTESRAAWFAETLPRMCRVLPWVGKLPEVFHDESFKRAA
jgi:hypothetical protein